MTRRPHKKSRRGCLQCKQRHIKCDETHPTCLLCKSANKICSFLQGISPAASSPHTQVQVKYSAATPSSGFIQSIPSPTAIEHAPKLSPTQKLVPGIGILNMVHLELLHECRIAMMLDNSFGLDTETRLKVYDVIFSYAMKNPFLMHEVLAVSALQLSTRRPHQRLFLRHTATELQTQALILLNAASLDDSIENVTARFLFASILGKHVLYETLEYRPADFGLFLERFISFMRLNRGARIELDRHWHAIFETGLRPLVNIGQRLPPPETSFAPECESLESLLKTADIGASSMEAYQQALGRLKSLFQLHRSADPQDLEALRSLVFSWLVTITVEFVELIVQRRPEALALLCHYAGLLHAHRTVWVVGDGALYMVESIIAYLGEYWEPWLQWPRKLVHLERLAEAEREQSQGPTPLAGLV